MDNLLARALGGDASQLMAEQRQALLSRLLSRLAHEVRNPLSSLDVHVQLLEEDLSGMATPVPKAAARVAIIRTELRRLDNLVQQFLSLAGPPTTTLRPVRLGDVLAHVQELFEPEAAMRGILLTTQIQEPLPIIQADAAQLTQALVNLVINALQAIERDGRIAVAACAVTDGEGICLSVQDTGPGIDLTRAAALFEPFFTTKAEGTGLGLWIVQQIATAHGGSVSATNCPEGGAVFSLRLPCAKSSL